MVTIIMMLMMTMMLLAMIRILTVMVMMFCPASARPGDDHEYDANFDDD